MKDYLYSLIFTKSFLIGFVVAVGIFSPYIFSDDSLLEELAELFIKVETGEDIDFTPKSKESSQFDINKYGRLF
jgi:hypothetical protein